MRLFSQDFNLCVSVSPKDLYHMFTETKFFSDSKILNTDSEKEWVQTKIFKLSKDTFHPGKIALENGNDPSIFSLWEVKTEGLKANACEIPSGSVIRLKNVATGHFLSFGSEISFLQRSDPRLVKNASKETAEIILEEVQKDDSAVLSQGFSKLGRLCLKIQSRQEQGSKSLVKEDLITLSLLKRQKYQLGIFQAKKKKFYSKMSGAVSKTQYGSSEFQSKSSIGLPDVAELPSQNNNSTSDSVFEDSQSAGPDSDYTLKFSEFCSSRQNHFKVLDSGMDFATERLASSFLSAVFEFYEYVQEFGFKTKDEKLYFDLEDMINKNAEFDSKIEMFSQSLEELQKFLAKDEEQFCKCFLSNPKSSSCW